MSDVNAVAMDIVILNEHIAQIDADAELQSTIDRDVCVALGLGFLHLRRAAQGVYDTMELDQEPVAHSLNQTAVMVGNLGLEDVLEVCAKLSAHSFFVGLAQTAITGNIGNHYGGKPAFHAPFQVGDGTTQARIHRNMTDAAS
jgi:hypothetical protein